MIAYVFQKWDEHTYLHFFPGLDLPITYHFSQDPIYRVKVIWDPIYQSRLK